MRIRIRFQNNFISCITTSSLFVPFTNILSTHRKTNSLFGALPLVHSLKSQHHL